MKQIYYTQCPIGYGLGASNGFQIKRLSPDYPVSGDFRQLGFRAFVPGSRTMAPPALRYRRGEQGAAEIAWLKPRSHEYETERGLWGRPGGHFAHGLLLDDTELERLGNWPAGLHDQPFWVRSDPSPTRGELPAPLTLGPTDLIFSPTFDAFARISSDADGEQVAWLLTALALVVREGRTLFLIGETAEVDARIAVLTLAFPAAWRPALTFSTYHDRPEELPGFRIQGTIPAARPNRQALLSQGIVADLASGMFEPRIEPAPWARTLAGWINGQSTSGRSGWDAAERRARHIRDRNGDEDMWSDAFLTRFYGLESLARAPAPHATSAADWAALADVTRWSAEHGLADELVPMRPPAWWLPEPAPTPQARQALLSHVVVPSAWKSAGAAAAWGETVARWVRDDHRTNRIELVDALLRAAPAATRPSFVAALVGALPAGIADETLRWLESHPTCDRTLLLPLGVRSAVDEAFDRRDPRRLDSLLDQAFELPGALSAVLDALAAAARARPTSWDALASRLVRPLESAARKTVAEFLRWAFRQDDDAVRWLGKYLRGVFADPSDVAPWRSLDALVPSVRKPALVRVLLTVTADSTVPDEAFRWAVEDVLLAIAETDRPHATSWPGAYLDRTPSGLDLLRRLFAKEYRNRGVKEWLESARARGELSVEQATRIDDCEQYARALRAGDARSLLDIRLPAVPAEDRGAMLAQILRHTAAGAGDFLNVALDTCRDAWPGAFHAGQPGLRGLAHALTDPLLELRADPAAWIVGLVRVLDRLGITGPSDAGFEPNSLAAEVVAETTRRSGPEVEAWRLRETLLRNDGAWRILALDMRRDVKQPPPVTERHDWLDHWDRHLDKGMHTARFFELWLNVCDGRELAAAVAARSADLRALGGLSWWASDQHPDSTNDLRDAFARLVPMAPLPDGSLTGVQNWLRVSRPTDSGVVGESALDPSRGATGDARPLSRPGISRWRCLEALTAIHREGLDSEACWQGLSAWTRELPLGELTAVDRYRFVAWFIRRVETSESYQIARLAKWLVGCGVTDADRVSRWADELEEISPVPESIRLDRLAMAGELRAELKNVIRDMQTPQRKTPAADSP